MKSSGIHYNGVEQVSLIGPGPQITRGATGLSSTSFSSLRIVMKTWTATETEQDTSIWSEDGTQYRGDIQQL